MNSGQRLTLYTCKSAVHQIMSALSSFFPFTENERSNLIRFRSHNAPCTYKFTILFVSSEKESVSFDKCQRLNNNHLWQNANKSFQFPRKKSINQNILPVTSKHVVCAQSMKRSLSALTVNIADHRLRLDCT